MQVSSSSSAAQTDPFAFDGRTAGTAKANVRWTTDKRERPMWVVDTRVKVNSSAVRISLPFGLRPGNAPGPLPSLSNRPCSVVAAFAPVIKPEERPALQASFDLELSLLRGLLGTMGAASTQEEIKTVRDYIEEMKGSYEFYTRRAAATINPNGLTVNERVVSQKAWGIEKATKTLKATQFGVSSEEAQAFYNHLASKPDWYRAFTETDLLQVTRLVFQQRQTLLGEGKPATTDSTFTALDEAIGPGQVPT